MATRERLRVAAGSHVAAASGRFARRRWFGRLGRWRRVLVLTALAAVLVAIGWLVWFSDVLAVRQVHVDGAPTDREQPVRAAAAVTAGIPLARVDLEAAAMRVERLAWVDDARAERDWPHGVRIVVTERIPVAVLAEADTYRALDGEGVVFDDLEEPPAGLPLVQGDELERATRDGESGARDDALQGVASVVEALDESVATEVDHLEVASLDAIVLVLSSGQRVEWGSAEDSALKSDVLRTLMRIPAGVYDVSVPEMPTTSGTAPS